MIWVSCLSSIQVQNLPTEGRVKTVARQTTAAGKRSRVPTVRNSPLLSYLPHEVAVLRHAKRYRCQEAVGVGGIHHNIFLTMDLQIQDKKRAKQGMGGDTMAIMAPALRAPQEGTEMMRTTQPAKAPRAQNGGGGDRWVPRIDSRGSSAWPPALLKPVLPR